MLDHQYIYFPSKQKSMQFSFIFRFCLCGKKWDVTYIQFCYSMSMKSLKDFGAVLKQLFVVLMAKSWLPLVETLSSSRIHIRSCMQQAIDQERSFRRSGSYMLLMTMKYYYDLGMEVSLWLNWYLYPTQISFRCLLNSPCTSVGGMGFRAWTAVCFIISILKFICIFPMPLPESLYIVGLKIIHFVFLAVLYALTCTT